MQYTLRLRPMGLRSCEVCSFYTYILSRKWHALLLGTAAPMRSGVFDDLARLVYWESNDASTSHPWRRCRQPWGHVLGTNTGKVYNTASSYCNSLLLSKIVEKLKIKVVSWNSWESRTFTNREKGWMHRYQFSGLLEERYIICAWCFWDWKIVLVM